MGPSGWRGAAAALLLVLLPAAAEAGAWPREPGRFFLSARADFHRAEARPRASLYGEYGLSRRITLGLQSSESRYEARAAFGLPERYRRLAVFARAAIGPLDARHRFAASLGASAPADAASAAADARLEAALHWGMGFETAFGGGWATATAKFGAALQAGRSTDEQSALIGLRPRDGLMAMLAASRYADATGATWSLSPSVGVELRRGTWLVPSLKLEPADRNATLGVSAWFNF
jgi:hypothetical protein